MLLLYENQQIEVRVLGFEGIKQCVLIGPLTRGRSDGDKSDDDEQQDGVESDEDEPFIYDRYYVLPYFDAHPR